MWPAVVNVVCCRAAFLLRAFGWMLMSACLFHEAVGYAGSVHSGKSCLLPHRIAPSRCCRAVMGRNSWDELHPGAIQETVAQAMTKLN